jgi:hypothetical protein
MLAGENAASFHEPCPLWVQSLAGGIIGYVDKADGFVFLPSFGKGAMGAAYVAALAANLDDDVRFRFDVTRADAA